MRNDDVIQSIRYMLDLNDIEIANILKLRGYKPERGEVAQIFKSQNLPDGEKGEDCSHVLMGHFLDGLIYHERGKNKKHPPRPIKTYIGNASISRFQRSYIISFAMILLRNKIISFFLNPLLAKLKY